MSDEQICRGIEFQLLGEDTQKARDAKEDLAQEEQQEGDANI